jgi:hypothetical protein
MFCKNPLLYIKMLNLQCRFTKRIWDDISNWLQVSEIHPNNWGALRATSVMVGGKGKSDSDFTQRTMPSPNFSLLGSVRGWNETRIFERVE